MAFAILTAIDDLIPISAVLPVQRQHHCDITGIKISTSKTEVINTLKNPVQSLLQVGDVLLKMVYKFKYLEVAFTSDERQDEELDVRSNTARSAVMQVLHHSVVLKRELLKTAKLSLFR